MNVVLIIDDVARMLGLRYLFKEYFDIDTVVPDDSGALEASDDDASTLYVTMPDRFCASPDFFIPRRGRTIVVGNGAGMLDLYRSETDVVEQLRLRLRQHTTKARSGAVPELSQREVDVLRLVAMGYINKEIADRLDISFNTVLSHRKNITAKLGIRSVSGLGVYALMNGIVSESDLSR